MWLLTLGILEPVSRLQVCFSSFSILLVWDLCLLRCHANETQVDFRFLWFGYLETRLGVHQLTSFLKWGSIRNPSVFIKSSPKFLKPIVSKPERIYVFYLDFFWIPNCSQSCWKTYRRGLIIWIPLNSTCHLLHLPSCLGAAEEMAWIDVGKTMEQEEEEWMVTTTEITIMSYNV